MAVTPVFVVLIDLARGRGTRPSRRVWLGLAAGFVGVCTLAAPSGTSDFAACVALILAALAWALGTLHARDSDDATPPTMSAAVRMLSGGALLCVIGIGAGERVPASVSPVALAAFGYLVVFGSLIGFGAYMYLVRRVPARAVATHSFVNPIVAVAFGCLVLDEPWNVRMLIAALLILISTVAIVWRRERNTTEIHRSSTRRRSPALGRRFVSTRS